MEVKVEKTEPSSVGEEPRPNEGMPLRVRVEFPFTRQTLMDNQVYFLELILKYGDQEGSPIMIDLRGEIPLLKEKKSEIPVIEVDATGDQSHPPPLLSSPTPASDLEASQGTEVSVSDDLPHRKNIIAKQKTKPKRSSHSCSKCNKRFCNKYKLNQHLFAHLSSEEKDAVRQGWQNICYFCSKRFQALSALETHLLVHTTEKPHICLKCKKQFSRSSHLATHIRLHNPATRRIIFRCNRCKKSFAEKSSLKRHIKMVHLGIKQFKCQECDYKCGQKGTMLEHINAIHRGIRYACRHPGCDKSFSWKDSLRRHEKNAHPKPKFRR